MQTITQTSKPSKQRKMLLQAPDHVRYKHFAAILAPELRKSYGTRSLPVRSGDTVRVLRGDHKGFEGKVARVDRRKFRIYVEGLTREKVDGSTVFVPIHPSKVMITKLNVDDKWRKKILERRKKAKEVAEKMVEKPPEEVVKVVEEKLAEEKPPAVEELPSKEKKPVRRKRAAKKPKEKVEEKMEEEAPEKKKGAVRRRKKEEGSELG
ncbi:MAG: 50S ribosomal protein L24 [Candidatus Bathyarchaeia archaeon]